MLTNPKVAGSTSSLVTLMQNYEKRNFCAAIVASSARRKSDQKSSFPLDAATKKRSDPLHVAATHTLAKTTIPFIRLSTDSLVGE
ncbi:hypothetical protein TNCV_454261 [Trichonephila clavipes]|nr:hypothetical protein TNCV_454261 [Trichonephila clavipes]